MLTCIEVQHCILASWGRRQDLHQTPGARSCAGFCMVGLYASVSLLSDHWAAIEAWEPAPAPDALEEPLLKQARGWPLLRCV